MLPQQQAGGLNPAESSLLLAVMPSVAKPKQKYATVNDQGLSAQNIFQLPLCNKTFKKHVTLGQDGMDVSPAHSKSSTATSIPCVTSSVSARHKRPWERRYGLLEAHQKQHDAQHCARTKCCDTKPEFFDSWMMESGKTESNIVRSRHQEEVRKLARERLRASARSAQVSELNQQLQEQIENGSPTERHRPIPRAQPPQSGRLALYAAPTYQSPAFAEGKRLQISC